MSERIITLFGEEIVPEQVKAVGKSRAKKKNDEKDSTDEPQEDIPAEMTNTEPATVAAENTPADTSADAPAQQPVAAPIAEEPKKKKAPAAKTGDNPAELPEDWKGDKQYFSIGEVAELFKVKTSHIRFWTNEFKLKVRTTRKGDRLYTSEQIRELRAIHHLVKERGFTLTGAKTKLKAQNNLDVETVDLKKSLLQLRNQLLAIKNQLK